MCVCAYIFIIIIDHDHHDHDHDHEHHNHDDGQTWLVGRGCEEVVVEAVKRERIRAVMFSAANLLGL